MAQVPQSPGTLWVRAGVLCSPAQALQPKATQTPTFRGWTDGNGEHVAIETVKAGDTLQARDADTGKLEARVVNRTSKVTSYELVTIEVADAASGKVVDTITGTPNHPFYVPGKGWVPLGQLGIGTSLVARAGGNNSNGVGLVVKSSRRESHPEGVSVYNFEVDGFHTYFVGKASGGVWVHNGPPCIDLLAPGGKPIGGVGNSPDIRVLKGGVKEAEDLFLELAARGGKDITPPSLAAKGGMAVQMPEGTIAFRAASKSGPPTIDVTFPSLPKIRKIKFLP